eukprot:m.18583 g.18583  ORF g.18583 m.18583 type:complete len:347 (-) comp11526_c1_seq1:160-1200(-)
MSWTPRYKLRLLERGIDTDTIRSKLLSDGYVVLRHVLDDEVVDDLRLFATRTEMAGDIESLVTQQMHCAEVHDLLLDPDFLGMTMGVLRTSESRIYPGYSACRHRQSRACSVDVEDAWHQEIYAIGNKFSSHANGRAAVLGTDVEGFCGSGHDTAGSDNSNAHDVNEFLDTSSNTPIGGSADIASHFGDHVNELQLLADALGPESAFACTAVLQSHALDTHCVDVVPGSHLAGPLSHRKVAHDTNGSCIPKTFTPVVLSQPLEHVNELTKPVAIELQPGDVLLHSMFLIKRWSAPKHAPAWVANWCYQNSACETRCTGRGHVAKSEDYDLEIQSAEEWSDKQYSHP